MKKVIAATGVTLTLALGTSVLPANNEAGNEAHAATQPYYNYTGYTSYDSSFLLDPNFINALKYNNFTINGYHMDFSPPSFATQDIMYRETQYDQYYSLLSSSETPYHVHFDAKPGQISKQDIINAYGLNYTENDGKSMVYNLNEAEIIFEISNDTVKAVDIY
ncbi:immunodominant antigen B [Staphylococcus piscifermentans]|uniref:immunodominant staphylococcal antigen IsaB family protein n=1 Tax=Staphylococcus piscifermentans TaxID=70258 RepID=UPI000B94C0E5|nr:hypothetical protein [Staphylococcus piscifermentans]RTX86527.1 hypothetical protein CD139_00965 [Staphylococcus piscifermentans]SNU95770.1 immunodominant antigen B [Staphylococcus piscifermentans]